MTTYYARKEYTYSGGDAVFSIPFSYINKEHIFVYINGEATENYTYLTDSQIQISDTLMNGDTVVIVRKTPITDRLVVFSNTSMLNKKNLNLAQEQNFDAVQEIYDNLELHKQDVETIKPHVGKLAANIDAIIAVNDNEDNINTVSADLTSESSKIVSVSTNMADINTVVNLKDDITTVIGLEDEMDTVIENKSDITIAAANASVFRAVNSIAPSITRVYEFKDSIIAAGSLTSTNLSDIHDVKQNLTNINAVKNNETNINAVKNNETNINAVKNNETNINTVKNNLSTINAVAGIASNVSAVANHIDDISNMNNIINDNLEDIKTVANNIGIVDDFVAQVDMVNQSKAWETGNISDDVETFNNVMSYVQSTFDINTITQPSGSNVIIDSNGIASGFSASDYIILPEIPAGKAFEIDLGKLNLFVDPEDNQYILSDYNNKNYFLHISAWYNRLFLYYQYEGNYHYINVDNVITDEGLYMKLGFNGTKVYLSISEDGDNYITYYSETNFTHSGLNFVFGRESNVHPSTTCDPILFPYDLKQLTIKVDGKVTYRTCKTVVDDVIKPNYTKVGNDVTVSDDGIASGFGLNNYIETSSFELTDDYDTLEIDLGTITSTDFSANQWFFKADEELSGGIHKGFMIMLLKSSEIVKPKHSRWFAGSGTSNYNIVADKKGDIAYNTGDKIHFKLVFNGAKYTLYSSVNDGAWQVDSEVASTAKINFNGYIRMGTDYTATCLKGTYDLNTVKIIKDGKVVYQPCLKIPYMPSKTGSKIVDAYYRDRVNDMYAQFGYAPYYTLEEKEEYNYGVVGSPTIMNGVVSNIDYENYVKVTFPLIKDWKINLPFYLDSSFSTIGVMCLLNSEGTSSMRPALRMYGDCIILRTGNSEFDFFYNNPNYATFLQASTNYNLEISYNSYSRTATAKLKNLDNDAVLSDTKNSSNIAYCDIATWDIGTVNYDTATSSPISGSVNLKGFKVYSNNATVWEYRVTHGNVTLPKGELYGIMEKIKKQLQGELIGFQEEFIGVPIPSLSDTIPDNCVFLEGATVSRTTYSKLFAIYGTTYNTGGEASDKFRLPNFKERVPWGSEDGTYGTIAAALPNITGIIENSLNNSFTAYAGAFTVGSNGITNNILTDGEAHTAVYNRAAFDASASNNIYSDDCTTVQPPALKVRWFTRYI